MRVTLIISSLSPGGAERVLSFLANYWTNCAWDVSLLTFDSGQTPPFYDLDERVEHVPLGIDGNSPSAAIGLWKNIKRVRRLRCAIRTSRPNVVISFMDTTNILTVLATRGLKIPVIVCERSDPTVSPIGRSWDRLRRWTYPKADRIVVQTKRASAYFGEILQDKIVVIPNPLSANATDAVIGNRQVVRPSVLAMGSLRKEKGFDLLIQAFSQVRERHSAWTLHIIGEGPLRAELESLRDKLGLTGHVYLPGLVKQPSLMLKDGDIFVMSSRREGFPNALLEAMACGLAVISTDCPSGPSEIIRNGIDGILVPSENLDELVRAMDRLMSDDAERRNLASQAAHVKDRLSVKQIMSMWGELLEKTINRL